MKSQVVEVGLLYRGDFRRQCVRLGIKMEEAKGLFDSTFRVTGDVASLIELRGWMQEIEDREADAAAAIILADAHKRLDKAERRRNRRWWQVWKMI